MSSEKEKTDAVDANDKRDMTKQQGIRGAFRVNGLDFAVNGIPFLCLAHVYDKIGSYIPGKEVSGGGGLKYNASIILMLSQSKMDDKDSEDKNKRDGVNSTKVGIVVSVTPTKQRFARPIKVQFHIPFYKKPNPFVGLESFVSWDSCGIIRGKMLTEKEFSKLSPNEQKECRDFEVDKKKMYAYPKDTARTLVCKHLGGEVPLSELFTEKVFTQEVLHELDSNTIKPIFQLPSIESLDDLAEITGEIDIENNVDDLEKFLINTEDGE